MTYKRLFGSEPSDINLSENRDDRATGQDLAQAEDSWDNKYIPTKTGMFYSAVSKLGTDMTCRYTANVQHSNRQYRQDEWKPYINTALDLLHVLSSSQDSEVERFAEAVKSAKYIPLEQVQGTARVSIMHEVLKHPNFQVYRDAAKQSAEEALLGLFLLSVIAVNVPIPEGRDIAERDIGDTIDRLKPTLEEMQRKQRQQSMEGDDINELLTSAAEEEGEGGLDGEYGGEDEGEGEGESGPSKGRGTAGFREQDMSNADAAYRIAGKFSEGGMPFTDLIGRAEQIADEQMEDIIPGHSQVSGVTLGGDPAAAMAHELAMPSEVFAIRTADQGLTQYERSTEGVLGRGPIVLVTDHSGSMDYGIGGGLGVSSQQFAQAVGFACMRVAAAQRRPFASVQFACEATTVLSLDDCSEADSRDYLSMLTSWVGGGTTLTTGLTEAMSLVEAHGFDGADIVCISDGDWEMFTVDRQGTPSPFVEQFSEWLTENGAGLIAFNTMQIDKSQDIVKALKRVNPETRAASFDNMNTVESFTEGLREALGQALSTDVVDD